MKIELRLIGGKRLKSPPGIETRPTTSRVREALINILRNKLNDSKWLDLFSGSGVVGCEALQNGASTVLAVEGNKKIAQICKENLISTASGMSNSELVGVIQKEVISFLESKQKKIKIKGFEEDTIFNFVYLDPPYKDQKIYSKVLQKLLQGNWITKNSIVICEHSTHMQITPEPEWIEIDRRSYGSSALLLITPRS